MTRRLLVAFAGGGAKALIHIGALKALEQRDVSFVGLAGTSAGAIIATLKAAGFSADDMINADAGTTILGDFAAIDPRITKVTHLFGQAGWRRIRAFRWYLSNIRWVSLAAGVTWILAIFLAGWHLTQLNALVAALAVVAILLLTAALVRDVIGGLASSADIARLLDTILQRKLFPQEPGRVVRMSDFGRDGRPTLKIVSANLTRSRLHLFSPDRTPDVPVAQAVAASMALPLIFSPVSLNREMHMDGGIVSNLPAWPFDEERELDPDATTIAVDIAGPTEPNVVTRYGWFSAFVRTGLFGSGELNLRVSGQAERLALTSNLDLLQFDLDTKLAFQEVKDAERAASVRLDRRLFRRPEVYRNACELTRAFVDDALATAVPLAVGRTRVAVAFRDPGYYRSLRLKFMVGYENDPDEGLLLPIEGSVVGAAWTMRESRLEILPFPEELFLPGQMNRVRRKLLRPDLKWMFCVPILHATIALPRLVVQIDGDEQLPLADEGVESAFSQIEVGVREFFGMIADELDELEDNDGLV